MTATRRDPDDDLVLRVGRGDAVAARTLVADKLPRMVRLAFRMLGDAQAAEDVAQEALLRAWKQAPSWKPGAARFDTWLHRVALNLCYDRLRRRREVLTDSPPDQPDPGPLPDQRWSQRDVARQIEGALMALPDRQREALVLCHYQELSNAEAAGLMNVSVEALESLLSRGRRTLRRALADLAPGRDKP